MLIGEVSVSDLILTGRSGETLTPTRPIEISTSKPAARGFAAVVKLRGEHDIATSGDLQKALAPIFGDALVDLSECSFIDSTIIAVLIVDQQLRHRDGHRLELFAPSENRQIARTLAVSGLCDLVTVHSVLPRGVRATV